MCVDHFFFQECIHFFFQECILCGSEKAVIKCVECFGTSSLLCVSCDGHVHTNAPLHDRQVWVGTHFVAVSPTTSFNQETKELMTVG